LEKLSILSCHSCTEAGIRNFVETFHSRQSNTLKIIWQRDRSHSAASFITDFYISLTNEFPWLCDGLSVRSNRKQFRAKFGEQIIIWKENKILYIQVSQNHISKYILFRIMISMTKAAFLGLLLVRTTNMSFKHSVGLYKYY
jgi:hypothetical protein